MREVRQPACARCTVPTLRQTRKVGILSTGVCRACAQQATPRQPCRNCGRTLLVAYRDADGEPWCDGCRRRAQAEPCSGCGARKVVCARDHNGPWCKACGEAVRPGPPCTDCGQRPSMSVPGADGVARCVPCYLAAQVPCARCGTTARAERHWPEGPVCLSCVDAVRLTHERCHHCDQLAGVFRREPAGPLCPDCAGVTFSYRCPTCGAMGRLLRGQCLSCTARRDLVEVFTQPDGQPAAWLAPLAELLENYDMLALVDRGRGLPGPAIQAKLLAPGQPHCRRCPRPPRRPWHPRPATRARPLVATAPAVHGAAPARQNNRRPLAGALRHRPTPYLFPGLRPDRPIASATLQTRLRKLVSPAPAPPATAPGCHWSAR
ncbi:MAG: hypothetical protein ACRDSL_26840, partial [Pseudonocardiaceae bacterium]